MPDLALVFDTRGISNSEYFCRRLESALVPAPGYHIVKHTGHSFVAVNVLKTFSFALEQPFFQAGDCLLIDGALYDDRPLTELVRILFSGVPRELQSLNGQFNAVIFRAAENEVTVVTDRLGCRPLYYASVGERHVISSEIRGVLAALDRTAEMNPVGLIELFAFAHNIEDRTVLDGITVLPPGSVITIDAKGVRQLSYAQFEYSEATQNMTPAEWGERISTCLKAIMPRYLRGGTRNGIFLSGGLDSRIVAGAIGTDSIVNAYTFGDPASREVCSGREIARRMGFAHDVLPFPCNYLSNAIRNVVARSECATPFFHASSILFHELIAKKTDRIFVGFGGSLSGNQLTRGVLNLSRKTDIAEYMFNHKLCATSVDIARVFQPSFFRKHWPETIEAFHASVHAVGETKGADVADVWEMRNRQRRFTFSAPKVDRAHFEVVAPMLDNDFVDLMTSLPVHMRWKQLAYRHAIVEGFPSLRSVPWAKTGRPVPAGRGRFWAGEWQRFGAKTYDLVISKAGLGGNLYRDKYRNIADDMRHDARLFSDLLYPCLSNGALPAEIFDPNGIRQLVDSHMSGQDVSHLLGAILTVAVFFSSQGKGAAG